MRHKVTTIRDLKSVLNDIVPSIKDPRYLYSDREVRNFRLRPREILANWLICSVKNHEVGPDTWTFSTDPPGGDGLIVKRSTRIGWPTEHIFIPTLKSSQNESVEDLMIKAVEHKHQNGEASLASSPIAPGLDLFGAGPRLLRLSARPLAANS